MNEQALKDSYELAKKNGYTKSLEEFSKLMNTNEQALKDVYKLAVGEGYSKSVEEFATLVKKKDFSETPGEDSQAGAEAGSQSESQSESPSADSPYMKMLDSRADKATEAGVVKAPLDLQDNHELQWGDEPDDSKSELQELDEDKKISAEEKRIAEKYGVVEAGNFGTWTHDAVVEDAKVDKATVKLEAEESNLNERATLLKRAKEDLVKKVDGYKAAQGGKISQEQYTEIVTQDLVFQEQEKKLIRENNLLKTERAYVSQMGLAASANAGNPLKATANSFMLGTGKVYAGFQGYMFDFLAPEHFMGSKTEEYRKLAQKDARESVVNTIGFEGQEDYIAEQQSGLLGGAYFGMMESLPSMLAMSFGGAAGVAAGGTAMFFQVADAVDVEMAEIEGMTTAEKVVMKSSIALVSSALEKFGIKNLKQNKTIAKHLFKKTLESQSKKVTANEFEKALVDATEHWALRYAKFGKNAFLAEGETGGLQEINEIGMKAIYNNWYAGEDMFETPDDINEFASQVGQGYLQEALGGFMMSAPKAIQMGFSKNNLAKEAGKDGFEIVKSLLNDNNALEDLFSALEDRVEAGNMTPVELEKQKSAVLAAVEVLNSIPGGMSQANERAAFDMISEKAYLEAELAELAEKDDALVEVNKSIKKARVEAINEELKALVQKDNKERVEREAEEAKANKPEAKEEVKEVVKEPAPVKSDSETVIVPQKEIDAVVAAEEKAASEGTLSENIGHTVFKDGKEGTILQKGQRIEFHSGNQITELGNVNEVGSQLLYDNGFTNFDENGLSFQTRQKLQKLNVVTVDGKRYKVLRESRPKKGEKIVKGQEVMVETNPKTGEQTIKLGTQKVFKGAQAETIIGEVNKKEVVPEVPKKKVKTKPEEGAEPGVTTLKRSEQPKPKKTEVKPKPEPKTTDRVAKELDAEKKKVKAESDKALEQLEQDALDEVVAKSKDDNKFSTKHKGNTYYYVRNKNGSVKITSDNKKAPITDSIKKLVNKRVDKALSKRDDARLKEANETVNELAAEERARVEAILTNLDELGKGGKGLRFQLANPKGVKGVAKSNVFDAITKIKDSYIETSDLKSAIKVGFDHVVENGYKGTRLEFTRFIAENINKKRNKANKPATTKEVGTATSALSAIPNKSKSLTIQKVEKLGNAIIKAGKKIVKGLNLEVLTDEEFSDKFGDGKAGAYNSATKTISVNASLVNARTFAHELFHAVLLEKFTSEGAIEATKDMVKALGGSISPEMQKRLDDFAADYKESGLVDEEFLAELAGELVANKEQLTKKEIGIIREWLNKLAKIIGVGRITNSEVVDLLNVIARKAETGEALTEADVKALGKGKKGNSSIRNQRTVDDSGDNWLSNAAVGLEKSRQGKMPADAWVRELTKQGGKGTAFELRVSGIETALLELQELRKKSITRDEVSEIINDHKLELVEIVLDNKEYDAAKEKWNGLQNEISDVRAKRREEYKEYMVRHAEKMDEEFNKREAAVDEVRNMEQGPERDKATDKLREFLAETEEAYQKERAEGLSGSLAYKDMPSHKRLQELQDKAEAFQSEYNRAHRDANFYRNTMKGGYNYRELLIQLGSSKADYAFTGAYYPGISHWADDNVVAHTRLKDRKLPNGDKVLHVEEIQSDWAQTGRKQGYLNGEELIKYKKQFKKDKEDLKEVNSKLEFIEKQYEEFYKDKEALLAEIYEVSPIKSRGNRTVAKTANEFRKDLFAATKEVNEESANRIQKELNDLYRRQCRSRSNEEFESFNKKIAELDLKTRHNEHKRWANDLKDLYEFKADYTSTRDEILSRNTHVRSRTFGRGLDGYYADILFDKTRIESTPGTIQKKIDYLEDIKEDAPTLKETFAKKLFKARREFQALKFRDGNNLVWKGHKLSLQEFQKLKEENQSALISNQAALNDVLGALELEESESSGSYYLLESHRKRLEKELEDNLKEREGLEDRIARLRAMTPNYDAFGTKEYNDYIVKIETLEANVEEYSDVPKKIKELKQNLSGPLPTMPYQEQKHWVNLVVRRLIKEAVDGGYKHIAWNTGEQVRSYTHGKAGGQQLFYEQILPKAFRDEMKRFDKSAAVNKIDFTIESIDFKIKAKTELISNPEDMRHEFESDESLAQRVIEAREFIMDIDNKTATLDLHEQQSIPITKEVVEGVKDGVTRFQKPNGANAATLKVIANALESGSSENSLVEALIQKGYSAKEANSLVQNAVAMLAMKNKKEDKAVTSPLQKNIGKKAIEIKGKLRRNWYTTVSANVAKLLDHQLHRITDEDVLRRLNDFLVDLANNAVPRYNAKTIDALLRDVELAAPKVRERQKAENLKGVKKNLDKILDRVGKIVDKANFDISKASVMSKLDSTAKSIDSAAKSLREIREDINELFAMREEFGEPRGISSFDRDALFNEVDLVEEELNGIDRAAIKQMEEYIENKRTQAMKGTAALDRKALSWMTNEQYEFFVQYQRAVRDNDSHNISSSENMSNILFDLQNGYIPGMQMEGLKNRMVLKSKTRNIAIITEKLEAGLKRFQSSNWVQKAFLWSFSKTGSVTRAGDINRLVGEREWSFQDQLLSTKREAILTDARQDIVRGETEVKQDVSRVADGLLDIIKIGVPAINEIFTTANGKRLANKLAKKKINKILSSHLESDQSLHIVGMLMSELDWREGHGEGLWKDVMENRFTEDNVNDRVKYRRTKKAYDALPKDKNGDIDTEKALANLSEIERQLYDFAVKQFKENRNKEQVSAMKRGLKFDWQEHYFPRFRVGNKNKAKDLELNTHADALINSKIASDRSKDRSSDIKQFMDINLAKALINSTKESSRDYHMYTPFKQAMGFFHKLSENQATRPWGDAFARDLKNSFNYAFNAETNKVFSWLTDSAYAYFLATANRLPVEFVVETLRTAMSGTVTHMGTHLFKTRLGTMSTLMEFTHSPYRHDFAKQNEDIASVSRLGKGKKGLGGRAVAAISSAPNKGTVGFEWMPAFLTAFEKHNLNSSGVAFDYTKIDDKKYLAANSELIKAAASIADTKTAEIKGTSSRMAQRTLIQFMPKFISNVVNLFGANWSSHMDATSGSVLPKAWVFMLNFMNRENLKLSEDFSDVFYADNQSRLSAFRNMTTQFVSGVLYGMLSYTSYLASDMLWALWDDDEERMQKDKDAFFELWSVDGAKWASIKNFASLKTAKYGQGIKVAAMVLAGMEISTLDKELSNVKGTSKEAKEERERLKAKMIWITKLIKDNYYADPIILTSSTKVGGGKVLAPEGATIQGAQKALVPQMTPTVQAINQVPTVYVGLENIAYNLFTEVWRGQAAGDLSEADEKILMNSAARLLLLASAHKVPFAKNIDKRLRENEWEFNLRKKNEGKKKSSTIIDFEGFDFEDFDFEDIELMSDETFE